MADRRRAWAASVPSRRRSDQKADYVFGLKGNQGTLHEDVALLFDERQDGFAGHAVTLHESFEKGHGRLETRRVVATDDLAWLQKDHQWPGMRSVAKVESRRCWSRARSVSSRSAWTAAISPTRYYIRLVVVGERAATRFGPDASGSAAWWLTRDTVDSASLWRLAPRRRSGRRQADEARGAQPLGRREWAHWVMDMVFRDECRIRSAHAPANFATIKHMASNLLRRGKGKHSMRASRHAGWDEDFVSYSLLTPRSSSNPTQSIALFPRVPRVGAVDRVAALARKCIVRGSANADDASRRPPAQ